MEFKLAPTGYMRHFRAIESLTSPERTDTIKPPADPRFDPAKPCKTRGGVPARILATDLPGAKPIAAAILHAGGGVEIQSYYRNGLYWNDGDKHGDDLFFAAPIHAVWVSAHREGDRVWFVTHDSAVKAACAGRDANCVGFKELKIEEGDGQSPVEGE